MQNNVPNRVLRCSFCGKSQSEVRKLISGPSVYICDECVELCREIIKDEFGRQIGKKDAIPLLKPMQIKEFLDEYVIEQERPKKIISVAVHNHYKRIMNEVESGDIEIQKSNILLIGPTGSGKTLLAQSLARLLQIPFTIADATCLTEAGYVGEDVENIVLNLVQKADYDLEAASRGIIYVDEIDKIARKSEGVLSSRDVSGEGVQQALLRIIEGTVIKVPPKQGRRRSPQDMLKIDTSNILFIFGGMFNGLEDIIKHRIGEKSIGFETDIQTKEALDEKDIMALVRPEDVIRFGMIPEFVGRIPIMATLDELSMEALVRVLTEPKNALLKQYKRLFELENVELRFTRGALQAIARQAVERKGGARGLRAILESIMLDIMYEIPSLSRVQECVIGEDVLAKGEPPLLIFEDQMAYA